MSIIYTRYRKEIINFVASLNIKFTPFADMVKKYVESHSSRSIMQDEDNPYYKNLAGIYDERDTLMYVPSVDTGEASVLFDRSLWTNHPKTASLYKPGTQEYTRLVAQYPSQVGLINTIIYPATDVATAINAAELTILNSDLSFLQSNEQTSLYQETIKFLDYMKYRWFIYDYCYEDQYPLVFMGTLAPLLVSTLLAKRVANLRTDAVHHMHVWDYLESNGLGDYETILSDVQARFLYRNLPYLKAHRGSAKNLEILADNLLKGLKVDLVGKVIYQQTRDKATDCETVPEFLSEKVKTYSTNQLDTNTFESMDNILSRFSTAGYYPRYSVENSLAREARFAKTISNELPTRVMEFKKYIINTENKSYLCEFLMQSLYYRASLGKLNYTISFKDEMTGIVLSFTACEGLALLHYIFYKRWSFGSGMQGEVPQYLPKYARVRIPYRTDKPTNSELPKTYFFNDFHYRIDSIVDTEQMLDEIPWSKDAFTSAKDMILFLESQWVALNKHTRESELTASLLYQWASEYFYQSLVYHGRVDLSLVPPYTTYTEWFSQRPELTTLFKQYDVLDKADEQYTVLMDQLIGQLLPVEYSEILSKALGSAFDDTEYYTALRNLFIEWTSYDLTYLDTSRTISYYLKLHPISVETTGSTEHDQYDFSLDALAMTSILEEYFATVDHVTSMVQYEDNAMTEIATKKIQVTTFSTIADAFIEDSTTEDSDYGNLAFRDEGLSEESGTITQFTTGPNFMSISPVNEA